MLAPYQQKLNKFCVQGDTLIKLLVRFSSLQVITIYNYTQNFFKGLSGSLILFMGFLASFPMGLISYKTKKPVLLTKLCGIVVITSLVLLGYFMREPNQSAAIITSSCLLGIFALGPYPLALELIVECTYPVDQVSSIKIISIFDLTILYIT